MNRKNIVGQRVREARKDAHLTQMELTAKLQVLGITIERSAIAKLESGKRPASDIEIAAIAKILRVSVLWLFEDADELFREQEAP